jgi:hypothetical protein
MGLDPSITGQSSPPPAQQKSGNVVTREVKRQGGPAEVFVKRPLKLTVGTLLNALAVPEFLGAGVLDEIRRRDRGEEPIHIARAAAQSLREKKDYSDVTGNVALGLFLGGVTDPLNIPAVNAAPAKMYASLSRQVAKETAKVLAKKPVQAVRAARAVAAAEEVVQNTADLFSDKRRLTRQGVPDEVLRERNLFQDRIEGAANRAREDAEQVAGELVPDKELRERIWLLRNDQPTKFDLDAAAQGDGKAILKQNRFLDEFGKLTEEQKELFGFYSVFLQQGENTKLVQSILTKQRVDNYVRKFGQNYNPFQLQTRKRTRDAIEDIAQSLDEGMDVAAATATSPQARLALKKLKELPEDALPQERLDLIDDIIAEDFANARAGRPTVFSFTKQRRTPKEEAMTAIDLEKDVAAVMGHQAFNITRAEAAAKYTRAMVDIMDNSGTMLKKVDEASPSIDLLSRRIQNRLESLRDQEDLIVPILKEKREQLGRAKDLRDQLTSGRVIPGGNIDEIIRAEKSILPLQKEIERIERSANKFFLSKSLERGRLQPPPGLYEGTGLELKGTMSSADILRTFQARKDRISKKLDTVENKIEKEIGDISRVDIGGLEDHHLKMLDERSSLEETRDALSDALSATRKMIVEQGPDAIEVPRSRVRAIKSPITKAEQRAHLKQFLDDPKEIERIIKDGFVEAPQGKSLPLDVRERLKGKMIPRAMKQEMEDALRFYADPEIWKGKFGIVKALSTMTNIWKPWQLFATKFHARNWWSQKWQMMLAGMEDPSRKGKYIDGFFDPQKPQNWSRDAQDMKLALAARWHWPRGNFNDKPTMKISGKWHTDRQLWKIMRDDRITSGGQIANEILRPAGEGLDPITRGLNKTIGRENPLLKKSFRTGRFIEDVDRMAVAFNGYRQGMTRFDAKNRVQKKMFDYRFGLTNFEQKTFRNLLVPFWAWVRFNIPMQVEMLMRQPRLFATFGRFERAAEDQFGGPDPKEELLAEWMQDGLFTRWRYNEKTEDYEYFMWDNFWPGADLQALMSVQAMPQLKEELERMAGPTIKIPVELLRNHKLFGEPDRKIERFKGEKKNVLGVPVSARAEHLLRSMRVINDGHKILQRLKGEGPMVEKVAKQFAEHLIGFNSYPVNFEEQRKRWLKTWSIERNALKRTRTFIINRQKRGEGRGEDEANIEQLTALIEDLTAKIDEHKDPSFGRRRGR